MKFLFANLTLLFAVVWSPAVQSVPCAEEIVSVLKDNAYLSELKDPDFLNAGLIAKLDPEEFSERLRRVDRYASYASADSFEKMKSVQKVAPAGVIFTPAFWALATIFFAQPGIASKLMK